MPKAKKYILSVGSKGVERLELLDEIFGPYTQRFLQNIGFRIDMRVLDVGCGIGNVTCWLARQVGRGKVIGVDISEEQINIAKEKAKEQKLTNVEFIASSVYDIGKIGSDFDLVFSRFLLGHLDQPEKAIQLMYHLVKPAGILACDEPCLSAAVTYPPSDAFEMSKSLTFQVTRQKGLDFNYGLKVYNVFKKMDFNSVIMKVAQPALISTHQKMLWPMFFQEARLEFLSTGLTTEEEYDKYLIPGLLQLAENDECYILPTRNFQVCGRK